jgi:hypothetical protein
MQREEKPVMATGLERIAAKARCEPKLRFTSLAHHITRERVWKNLNQIPTHSAPGSDGQGVSEAKEDFSVWIEPMLESVHRQGYQAPPIRRVYIPKPGKQEKRPLGVPTPVSYCTSIQVGLGLIRPVQLNLVAQGGRPALCQAALLTNWSGMVCSRTQVS